MATTLHWHDREDISQRRQTGVHAWGKTFQRTYTVGTEEADTLPERGEVMDGESGITAPRVVNWLYDKKASGGVRIVVNWAQVVAYTDDAGTVSASTTLLELRGSRIPTTDGKYRYATRIYAGTTAQQADNIPALYTDSVPATDSDDNLARRKTSTIPNDSLVPGLWVIQANYMGFLTRELVHLKDHDANTITGPRAKRVFVEMAAGVESKTAGLIKSYFPSVTPQLPCFSAKASYRPFGIADIALVEAHYGLATNTYVRKIGYARISAKVVSRGTHRVLFDVTDSTKQIEGWDESAFWQVVEGSNVVGDSALFVYIETAAAVGDFTLKDALALKGRVNRDTFNMAIYGQVAVGTWKCESVEVASTLQTDLMPLNYVIEVDLDGWNGKLKSQKSQYQIRNKAVFDAAGVADSGDTRPVEVLVPAKILVNGKLQTAPKEDRQAYETVTFSRFFAGLKQWKL